MFISRKSKVRENLTDYLFAVTVAIAMMLLVSFAAQAQNVGINNPSPHAKSLLDLTATDKGLLTPRLTQAQRTAMFPAADATAKGMLVYQTDNTQGFYYYDGAAWQFLGNSTTGWTTTGNTGTSSSVNFMGTTDAQDVVFKSNNAEGMRLRTNGNVGIGSTSPYTKLTVYSNDSGYVTGAFRNLHTQGWSGLWFMTSANGFGGHFGYGNASAPRWANQVYAGSIASIPFVLTTGDTERMRIDASGNVGIDTTGPQARLHVKSNSAVGWPQILVEERDSADYSRISFMNKGCSKFWTTAAHSETSYDSLSFYNIYNSSTGNLLTIKGNGNVGIGNSYPTSKLEVMGSIRIADGTQGTGKVLVSGSTGIGSWQTLTAGSVNAWGLTGNSGTSSSTNFIGTTDAQPLVIRTNNSPKVQVETDGRIQVFGNNNNTIIGQNAGNASLTGVGNTMVGLYSGANGTTGGYSTFLGYQSGRDNNSSYNTFLGYNAGVANNSGMSNVSVGMAAGYSNVSGSYNINIGHAANGNNTTGNANTVIGYYAASLATSSANNTIIGYQAGYNTTSGDNTFVGYGAGSSNTTGTQNTYLGSNAQGSLTISKAVAIGYNATVTASNSMALGGTGSDAVKVGIGVSAPASELEVNGYTMLGANAPAIKTLLLTGTTASSQGNQVSVAHGLTSSKILSVDVLVEYTAGSFVHHSYTWNGGYDFNFYITGTNIYVANSSTNSGNILSKPFKIFITYMQ